MDISGTKEKRFNLNQSIVGTLTFIKLILGNWDVLPWL